MVAKALILMAVVAGSAMADRSPYGAPSRPSYQPPSPPSYKAPSPSRYSPASEEAHVPPKYQFDWSVNEDYTKFNHEEQRDYDNTKGSYSVDLPDGRRQTVTYYVDGDSGFVAEVSYSGEARYPEEQSREYSAPAPVYNTPRPSYQPAPTTPRPVYTTRRTTSRPVYTTRRPAYTTPRPTYNAPRPTYNAPRPSPPRNSYNAPSADLLKAYGF